MNAALNDTTSASADAQVLTSDTSDTRSTDVPGLRDGQAVRRTFTADYKRRVIAEYEAAPHGQKGAVLRREKLYDTQLAEWRAQQAAGTLASGGKKTGRPPTTADQKRVRELEGKLAKAEAALVRKDQVIADRDAALEVLGKGVAFLEALTSNTVK